MSAPACEKVTSIESGGGSSSNDKPIGEHEELAIVIQSDIGDEWLRSIMNEADESSSNTMPKHKIQKVPQMLRQMEPNKKYYNPEVISIGPYHRDKEVAQAGENTKLKSLDKFKTRFTREYVKSCEPPSITILYDKVAEVASEARKCYAEGSTEGINDRAFTQMMFLDGCFILQFIYYKCTEKKEEQAKMKMKINDIAYVQRDLFLLENQLPFKVLQALMSMNSNFAGDNKGLKLINEFISSTRASPRENSFREKVENFITKYITDRNRKQHPGSAESHSQGDGPAHLLELMHRQLINPIAIGNVTKNKIVA